MNERRGSKLLTICDGGRRSVKKRCPSCGKEWDTAGILLGNSQQQQLCSPSDRVGPEYPLNERLCKARSAIPNAYCSLFCRPPPSFTYFPRPSVAGCKGVFAYSRSGAPFPSLLDKNGNEPFPLAIGRAYHRIKEGKKKKAKLVVGPLSEEED